MFRAVITYVDSPDMARRQFLKVVKAANEAAVEFWWQKWLPHHFTTAGGKKYGYQARRGDNEPPIIQSKHHPGRSVLNRHYSWQKRRRKGHNRPLVWSGAGEFAARSSIRITSNAGKATGVLSMPRYFYQFRKDLKTPDKSAELVTVTADEAEDLALFHGRKVSELMSVRRGETGQLVVT